VRRLATLAALAALQLAAPAALAIDRNRVLVVGDCTHAQFKPAKIVIACGDGNEVLTHLSWSTWTAAKATGKGMNSINSCTPTCAGGHFKDYAVTVTLSKPHHCAKLSSKVFSRATLHFTHGRPAHVPSNQTLPIACPL
jgi:hypothetical protein